MFSFMKKFFSGKEKNNRCINQKIFEKSKDLYNPKIIEKSKDLYIELWQPIETAPKDKVIILGVDSYDCGWVFDTGIYDPTNGKWLINSIEKKEYLHMNYTHWLDPKNLQWVKLSNPIINKVILLGKFENENIIPCSAWFYVDEKTWIFTSSLKNQKIDNLSSYTHYTIPPEPKNIGIHLTM